MLQNASEVEPEFDRSIRFITVAVALANERPSTYLREIPPLSDASALSDMVGLPLRTIDLLNLLLSKFPTLDIVTVTDDLDQRVIRIVLGSEPDPTTHDAVTAFVSGFELPAPIVLQVTPNRKLEEFEPPPHAPLFVWASRLRPHAPRYVRQDEAFWFDNISAISSNEFPLTSFPGLRADVFRCYMDLTAGVGYMNIRQALLLYDEVWCSLPLELAHGQFLRDQALTEEDLLKLVESGRLRFVTTQPEERLNVQFLDAVYERNRGAILGRRTTAALLVADLVRTAESSHLNDPSMRAVLPVICETLASSVGTSSQSLMRAFLWPLASRRGSLQALLDYGSWGSPIADLAQLIADHFRSRGGLDVELEVRTLSPAVHVAHALNATLFGSLSEPKGWHLLQSAVGRHLNFHRHFNRSAALSWTENELRRENGTRVMPVIRLFEFDQQIPIEEIISDSSLWSTRARGRSLYARLANLPEVERQEEVDALEAQLRKKARKATDTKIDFEAVETALATTALMADFVFPPLAGLTKLGRKAIAAFRTNEKIDRMLVRLEEGISSVGSEHDLDFMSRIARVATFRRDRI